MGYNNAGTEFGVIIFKRTDTNWGVILRVGYSVEGIEEIRFIGGVAQTSDWVKTVTISDFGYIDYEVNTIANSNIPIPGTPDNARYIPIVIGHGTTNNCAENIFYTDSWRIHSTVSQKTFIRLFKYPVGA